MTNNENTVQAEASEVETTFEQTDPNAIHEVVDETNSEANTESSSETTETVNLIRENDPVLADDLDKLQNIDAVAATEMLKDSPEKAARFKLNFGKIKAIGNAIANAAAAVVAPAMIIEANTNALGDTVFNGSVAGAMVLIIAGVSKMIYDYGVEEKYKVEIKNTIKQALHM